MQTEGILGNEIIHKLHADFYENLGVAHELNYKPKEALNFYKKSLKTKFKFYGENHDEVLDLQYKIASIYITLKQFIEAEEIVVAMAEVVQKEKMKANYYRYGVYFYTAGSVLLKNNKVSQAKEYLIKAESIWKDILSPGDPALSSIKTMLKICKKNA